MALHQLGEVAHREDDAAEAVRLVGAALAVAGCSTPGPATPPPSATGPAPPVSLAATLASPTDVTLTWSSHLPQVAGWAVEYPAEAGYGARAEATRRLRSG